MDNHYSIGYNDCFLKKIAHMSRRSPPRPPAAPPASIEEGAARVSEFVIKRHDRQDGQGVNWRLLMETLFRAAFRMLDRLPDDQRRAVALRVHEASYRRMTDEKTGDAEASKTDPIGSVRASSNTTFSSRPRRARQKYAIILRE